MTYTTAHGNARSLTHRVRPGIEPAISWILVRFVSAEPHWKLLSVSLLLSSPLHCFHCCLSFLPGAPRSCSGLFVFPFLSLHCKADPVCICLQPISQLPLALESSLKSTDQEVSPSGTPDLLSFRALTTWARPVSGRLYPSLFSSLIPALLPQ